MRKFDQMDGTVTLAIMLGREAVKITHTTDEWYKIEAITASNRRLVALFTLLAEEVPEEVINVESYDYDDGVTTHGCVRDWLKIAADKGRIYVHHYIHAYNMDDSTVFAAYLGRECSEEE